jgi:hypothetical protein
MPKSCRCAPLTPETDARTAESPGPAYTDLTDGRPERKPVIPAHWQTWQEVHLHLHGISAEDIAAIFDRRNE